MDWAHAKSDGLVWVGDRQRGHPAAGAAGRRTVCGHLTPGKRWLCQTSFSHPSHCPGICHMPYATQTPSGEFRRAEPTACPRMQCCYTHTTEVLKLGKRIIFTFNTRCMIQGFFFNSTNFTVHCSLYTFVVGLSTQSQNFLVKLTLCVQTVCSLFMTANKNFWHTRNPIFLSVWWKIFGMVVFSYHCIPQKHTFVLHKNFEDLMKSNLIDLKL